MMSFEIKESCLGRTTCICRFTREILSNSAVDCIIDLFTWLLGHILVGKTIPVGLEQHKMECVRACRAIEPNRPSCILLRPLPDHSHTGHILGVLVEGFVFAHGSGWIHHWSHFDFSFCFVSFGEVGRDRACAQLFFHLLPMWQRISSHHFSTILKLCIVIVPEVKQVRPRSTPPTCYLFHFLRVQILELFLHEITLVLTEPWRIGRPDLRALVNGGGAGRWHVRRGRHLAYRVDCGFEVGGGSISGVGRWGGGRKRIWRIEAGVGADTA